MILHIAPLLAFAPRITSEMLQSQRFHGFHFELANPDITGKLEFTVTAVRDKVDLLVKMEIYNGKAAEVLIPPFKRSDLDISLIRSIGSRSNQEKLYDFPGWNVRVFSMNLKEKDLTRLQSGNCLGCWLRLSKFYTLATRDVSKIEVTFSHTIDHLKEQYENFEMTASAPINWATSRPKD